MASEKLTEEQIDILAWLDRFPSTRSEWTDNGKRARKGRDTWSHLKISGPRGSILVAKEDIRALSDFVVCQAVHGKMWDLTPAGRFALEQSKGRAGGASA